MTFHTVIILIKLVFDKNKKTSTTISSERASCELPK